MSSLQSNNNLINITNLNPQNCLSEVNQNGNSETESMNLSIFVYFLMFSFRENF